MLESLTLTERGEVLANLLVVHPQIEGEAIHIASELLSACSTDDVASEVETAMVSIPLDDLGVRAGRVRGRGYIHETDAAWELVEEAIEPFRSDLERRAVLGYPDAAANTAVGIVAGLYRARNPEMRAVLAYAGEDAPLELAADALHLAAELEVTIPDGVAETYWPCWDLLR